MCVERAARGKGIDAPVAGRADLRVAPEIEAGDMLAKQPEYLGGAANAGIVAGARVPIAPTRRTDGVAARVVSCARAALPARHRHAPVLADRQASLSMEEPR